MLVVTGVIGLLALVAWGVLRGRPQDLPWTPLDLSQPIGAFTGRKLTALGEDFGACRALLDRAGVRYTALPPRDDGSRCGYSDAVRFTGGGARDIAYAPAHLWPRRGQLERAFDRRRGRHRRLPHGGRATRDGGARLDRRGQQDGATGCGVPARGARRRVPVVRDGAVARL
jgi:hypothetical protein